MPSQLDAEFIVYDGTLALPVVPNDSLQHAGTMSLLGYCHTLWSSASNLRQNLSVRLRSTFTFLSTFSGELRNKESTEQHEINRSPMTGMHFQLLTY